MSKRDEIIAAIRKIAERLGRAPSQAEFRKESKISWHQVYKHFRGMRAAVRAAGLEPGPRGGPLDENALVLDWARVVRELGRLPSRAEYVERGKHHSGTLHTRLGWSQMAHRFVLLVREFHLEAEWSDVVEVVCGKFPLLRSVAASKWQLANSKPGSTAEDAENAKREDLAADLRGWPQIGGRERSGDREIGTSGDRKGHSGRVWPRMDMDQNPGSTAEYAESGEREDAAADLRGWAQMRREQVSRELTRTNANQINVNQINVNQINVKPGMRLGRVVAAALALEMLRAWVAGNERLQLAESGQLVSAAAARPVQSRTELYGAPLGIAAMAHAPTNEAGVIFLFGVLAAQLGFRVERMQTAFPDCEAKREIVPGKWEWRRIEFEFESRNFKEHRHDPEGCDVIVCWRHNWADCPERLEVVELSKMVR